QDIQINPNNPIGTWEASYGSLPQNVQNALMDCKLAQDNAKHFNTGVPPSCQKSDSQIIADNMPKVVTPGNAPNVIPNPNPAAGGPPLIAAPPLPGPVATSQLPQALIQASTPAADSNSSTQPGTVSTVTKRTQTVDNTPQSGGSNAL